MAAVSWRCMVESRFTLTSSGWCQMMNSSRVRRRRSPSERKNGGGRSARGQCNRQTRRPLPRQRTPRPPAPSRWI